MNQNYNTIKNLCLFDEIETSSKLIQVGLGELQNINSGNDFYYLPFQLLSSGFERLMKCIICIGYFNEHQKYPDTTEIKTHDLLKLKELILKKYFKKDSPLALKEDFEFISKDKNINQLMYLLSEFGKYARYYNLDVVTGTVTSNIDIKRMWQEYETQLFLDDKSLSKNLYDFEKQEENNRLVVAKIIILLERFIRALCRQLTLGNLGDKAKQFSGPLFDFILISDSELGNKDYRKNTTRYKTQPKKVHKRTIQDEIKRKFNQNYISKQISKQDFEEEWPFYSDTVTIECRYKHWCIITIDGYDYALNGAASGRYKLENVFDAGMAKPGISIGPFIDMALKLLD